MDKRKDLQVQEGRIQRKGEELKECEHENISTVRVKGRAIQTMCNDCLKVFQRFGKNPRQERIAHIWKITEIHLNKEAKSPPHSPIRPKERSSSGS